MAPLCGSGDSALDPGDEALSCTSTAVVPSLDFSVAFLLGIVDMSTITSVLEPWKYSTEQ
jgi:hypothetical protein